MSLYKRLHTPNSPLLPLSPMCPNVSPSMYLSPYTTSIRSRRSFTPNHLNVLPPPSLSPIQAGILSSKKKLHIPYVSTKRPSSPERRSSNYVVSSTKKSMKKVRSSVRFAFSFGFFCCFLSFECSIFIHSIHSFESFAIFSNQN